MNSRTVSYSQSSNTPIFERYRPLVLIVDDDPIALKMAQEAAESGGFRVKTANSGQTGWDLFQKIGKADCYVIDLHMPVMSGDELIRKIKNVEDDAVIIVQTVEHDPQTIVETMKLGVYDYFLKPINPELFLATVNRAHQHKMDRRMRQRLDEQAAAKLRTQLQWLNYKEEHRELHSQSQERNLIYNLMTSMNQGAGFGSLLTMIDLIRMKEKRDEQTDSYSIPTEMMHKLFRLSEISRNMLNGLESILELIEKDFERTKFTIAHIEDQIKDLHGRFSSGNSMNHSFQIHSNPEADRISISINIQNIALAMEELLYNAIKYTPAGGSIDFFSHRSQGYAIISCLNDVSAANTIPPEYERIVIEPFIRLRPPVETIAHTERFGLGLGLSVVNHIARKHGGLFYIQEVKDHTRGHTQPRVLAEVYIPELPDSSA